MYSHSKRGSHNKNTGNTGDIKNIVDMENTADEVEGGVNIPKIVNISNRWGQIPPTQD
jgi:hypothetical protein